MKRLKFLGAILIFVILLLKPEGAAQDAQRAMRIWYSSVAPALFPFLALMPLLTGEDACRAYEVMFSKWMRPLLRLPGSAAPAIIAGMIAGSPGGAITLRRVAKNSQLSASGARRIAFAFGGVSPAFLIIGVGQGLHGSISVGIKLAVIQVGVQVLMLLVIPDDDRNEKLAIGDGMQEAKNPIMSAVEGIIGVCGYMVFYSVVAGAISGVLGKGVGNILLPFMDLPSGLAGLAGNASRFKKFVQGTAIGFSGLCIISQNMNVLRELNIEWKQYILARLASAAMFGISCVAMESSWNGYIGRLSDIFSKTYAISLLIAGIIVIPGIFLFSKNLFLNKYKRGDNG